MEQSQNRGMPWLLKRFLTVHLPFIIILAFNET